MKASLWYKLVFALLARTLIVLLATRGLARWSFERGFLDYVNALEQVRLDSMGEELIHSYQQANNSWDRLTPEAFTRALRYSFP